MPRCSILLLGEMQITLDDKPLHSLESVKARALLAYLAVESGKAHGREKLAGLLWPEVADASARQSLSQALYNLRQSLGQTPGHTTDLDAQPSPAGGWILTSAQTVQFNPLSDHCLDVHEFERRLAEVRRHPHPRRQTCASCAHLLQECERLYRGDFLTEISPRGCPEFEEWALLQRERLRGQLCEVLSSLSEYHAGRGDLFRALQFVQRWVQVDPFSEGSQRQLLRLLALNGQRSEALARYAGFCRLLASELSAEPEKETHSLYQRILAEETAQASPPGQPGRLPVPLTPFIGRSTELAEVTALLRQPGTRLLTILGAGGSGKTRLALQAAQTLRYEYPDGIFFVSLSGLAAEEALVPAVAEALGFAFQEGRSAPRRQLLDYLERRRLLFIFDSFEELPAASGWMSQLLQAAPEVQVLATSRVRLNVHFEQVFPLDSLPYPVEDCLSDPEQAVQQYAAVELFQSAARRVRPDYAITHLDLPHVGRICRLTSGMPLGIILASSWLETVPPAEIAAQIERSLDFLASDWSDVPERQRSLRATLNHSWQLLGKIEQQVLCNIAVFHGTFSPEAAQAISQAQPAHLRALVDKSMLHINSENRYRTHDLVHQYLSEQLTARPEVEQAARQRHSAFFLQATGEQERHLKSARQRQALQSLDEEFEEIQAAWRWAAAHGPESLLAGALESLGIYCLQRLRYTAGQEACAAALQDACGPGLAVRLATWQARFTYLLGQTQEAEALCRRAQERLLQAEADGQVELRDRALLLFEQALVESNLPVRLQACQQSIDLFLEAGDPWWAGQALRLVSETTNRLHGPKAAIPLHQQCLALNQQVGEPGSIASAMYNLAYSYLIIGDIQAGERLVNQAADHFQAAGDRAGLAQSQLHGGTMLAWRGQYAKARGQLQACLPLLQEYGYHWELTFGTGALGISQLHLGNTATAAAQLNGALQVARQCGYRREEAFSLAGLGWTALAQGQPAQALPLFQESASHYRSMQYAGELGTALGGMALAYRGLRQPEQAITALLEALGIAEKTHSLFAMVLGCPAAILLLIDAGEAALARELHRAALGVPLFANSLWYNNLIEQQASPHWKNLPPPSNEAAPDLFGLLPEIIAALGGEPPPP